MLKQVEVRTSQGTQLILPLDDMSSGIFVQKIVGLDPVKAILVSSSFANLDGAQYQSSRRESRNLLIKVGLEPNYLTTSVSQLRQSVYSFFMPQSEVTMTFVMSDGLSVDIKGRVESCESDQFNREPTVDISLLCFNPDFYDTTPVIKSGMSTSVENQYTTIPYVGSVDSGILMSFLVAGTISEITVYQIPPDGTFRSMEFSYPMLAGDRLDISTIPGNKYVRLTRGNVTSEALYGLSSRSNWLEFTQGNNQFQVYVEGTPVAYTLTYTNRYGGL